MLAISCSRTRVVVAALLALAALVVAPRPSAAQPIREADIPPALAPWVPWVLEGDATYGCSMTDEGTPRCDWLSLVRLEVLATEGRFTLEADVDHRTLVPVPGAEGRWPIDVRVDGSPRPVRDSGGPHVELEPGRHRIEGRFRWSSMPETLPIPASVARIELVRNGVAVPRPERGASGEVWLRNAETHTNDEDVVSFEVHRRVDDGTPLSILTSITVRASGRSRELPAQQVLVPGSVPVEVTAELPVRLSRTGELTIQVRAGTYRIQILSYIASPEAPLALPPLPEPWPAQEVWVWSANEAFRQVEVEGAPPIDPQRTSLPAEWRSLPAFLVERTGTVTLHTIRRGEPQPPPNQLSVDREFWMDLDGQGYTVRDTLSGLMHQTYRLELTDGELGRVSINGADQLITRGAEHTGVELRSRTISATAEGRLLDATSSLPAVGWSEDAQRATATLHLPPGFALLHAEGADSASGTWLDRWQLLSLFSLILISVAVGYAFGAPLGAVAFVALGISFHESDAPIWLWLAIAVFALLARTLRDRRWIYQLARAGYLVFAVVLLIVGLLFVTQQAREGLYPQLANPWGDGFDYSTLTLTRSADSSMLEATPAAAPMEWDEGGSGRAFGGVRGGNADFGQQRVGYSSNSLFLDPNAVVQTGPGVPNWSWRTYTLRWDQPVAHDHRVSLYLVTPPIFRVLAFLRVALTLGLLAIVVLRRPASPEPEEGSDDDVTGSGGAAAAVAATLALAGVVLFGPHTAMAQAIPTPELLGELRGRLVRAPECQPNCSEANDLSLRVEGDRLTIELVVHASVATAHPLPGPSDTWTPTSVTLDGIANPPLARFANGFLYARVPAGAHTIRLEGPVGQRDALALAFGRAPRNLSVDASGWEVEGLGAEGRASESVQLRREIRTPEGDASGVEASELPSWIEVQRTLVVGVRWTLRTTVRRRSPGNPSVVVRIPLLEGESVTESAIAVDGGQAVVNLGPRDTEVTFTSALTPRETITLQATDAPNRTEVWSLECGPLWHCEHEGLAATTREASGEWAPTFHPWPGESLTLHLTRPMAAEGQSTTIDSVMLDVTPGVRLTHSSLTVSVRSSTSAPVAIDVPPDAEVRALSVNGQSRPLQREGDTVRIATQPGTTSIVLDWQTERGWESTFRTPVVRIADEVVNATVHVNLGSDRWFLWVTGPSWGPAVLFWGYLALLLVLGYALSRRRDLPLGLLDWALLGMGMLHVESFVPFLIVGWFFAVRLREQEHLKGAFLFDLGQLALVGYTFIVFWLLVYALQSGLLGQPDSQISGPGSNASELTFYVDRTEGALPTASIISVPLWVFRVIMFAWSLWLAVSVVRWTRWGFAAFRKGGMWRTPTVPTAPAPSAPASSATASSATAVEVADAGSVATGAPSTVEAIAPAPPSPPSGDDPPR